MKSTRRTAATTRSLRAFSEIWWGRFRRHRRVRDTKKLGLFSFVLDSAAARLRFVLSAADMASQAAEPSSICPSFICEAAVALASLQAPVVGCSKR